MATAIKIKQLGSYDLDLNRRPKPLDYDSPVIPKL